MKYPFYLAHKKASAPLCGSEVKSALGIESHTDWSVDIVQKSMLWITILFGTFIIFFGMVPWFCLCPKDLRNFYTASHFIVCAGECSSKYHSHYRIKIPLVASCKVLNHFPDKSVCALFQHVTLL